VRARRAVRRFDSCKPSVSLESLLPISPKARPAWSIVSMSTQNERQVDRRQESRCCAAYARIRPRDFRARQSDELVEFFLPQSLRRKSDFARLSSSALTKIERIQTAYFFCSFSFGIAGAAAVSPSSFFSPITSGPATAAASATTGSSSTVGARTENAVRSGGTLLVTPDGS